VTKILGGDFHSIFPLIKGNNFLSPHICHIRYIKRVDVFATRLHTCDKNQRAKDPQPFQILPSPPSAAYPLETRANLCLHSCPSLVRLTTKVDRSLPPSPSRDLPSPFFNHRPTVIVPTVTPNRSFPLLFNPSNLLPTSPPEVFPSAASSSLLVSSIAMAIDHETGPVSSLTIDHNGPSFISIDAAKLPSSAQTGLHQMQRQPLLFSSSPSTYPQTYGSPPCHQL